MLTYDQALQMVLERSNPPDMVEGCPLSEALGRALAEPFLAAVDSPRFTNSAVDGYGVRVADVPGDLEVAGTVAAGDAGFPLTRPGTAIRIFTGAPIPSGVEAVVMQEDCVPGDRQVSVRCEVHPGENIRMQGEEYSAGDFLLPAGVSVTPAVAGLIASNGISKVPCRPRLNALVLTTGDELIASGEAPSEGHIYESNGIALTSALRALGVEARQRHVRDNPRALEEAVRDLEDYDLVLTSGGVSVGERDLVRGAMDARGVCEVFWRVSIKPGKPVYFGTLSRTLVFGLPGNPVSALVTFQLFVRPAVLQRQGHAQPTAIALPARMGSRWTRRAGREEFVRATLSSNGDSLVATPLDSQGSHMAGGLARADCLIRVPAEVAELAEGEPVRVLPLTWGVS